MSVIDRQVASKPDMTVCAMRTVPISLDQAWDAWTTAGGMRSWWREIDPDVTCSVDPRVGAGYRIDCTTDGFSARGRVVAIDRPSRLILQWRWVSDRQPSGNGLAEVTFTVDEEDVAVTVVHTVSGDVEPCAERWNRVLDAMARLGPDGRGLVCPRCGWSIAGDPPVCTGVGCPLARRDRWRRETYPVPLIDY